MIGYDLDGTLCQKKEINKSYFKCKGWERAIFKEISENHYKTTELVREPLEEEYVIITSRRSKYANITYQWLSERSLKPIKVFFMQIARTRPNMIKYKSETINEIGLTKYYEDDPKICKRLTKLCPNTEIINVDSIAKEYILENFKKSTLQL